MDSRNGESERLLVNAALERSRETSALLVGGLGVGFSLEAALLTDVGSVTVIEVEPAVIRWATSHFTRLTRLLTDPRLTIVCAEFRRWLSETTGMYDAVCLDVDNGPEWLSRSENSGLYTDTGLARVAGRLTPGGTLSIWSANRSRRLERSLARVFDRVERLEVPVARGEPDVIYIARTDTRPEPAS